jgi:hypothetical protein
MNRKYGADPKTGQRPWFFHHRSLVAANYLLNHSKEKGDPTYALRVGIKCRPVEGRIACSILP